MTTLLNKTVKREVRIRDQAYIVAISPLTLKLTPKGKRKGLELHWTHSSAATRHWLPPSMRRWTSCRRTPRGAPRPSQP